jgi:hypothetical protein
MFFENGKCAPVRFVCHETQTVKKIGLEIAKGV